jgi:curli production assembly/transport component CsgE
MLRTIAAIVLATAASAPSAADSDERFGAAVTNQTVTVTGQQFYTAFCAFWHDKPFSERFAIAVREHPSARSGTRVVVEFAGRAVFQGMLQRSNSNIRPISERAVEIAYDNVVNTDFQRLLLREQDLGPDEI